MPEEVSGAVRRLETKIREKDERIRHIFIEASSLSTEEGDGRRA